METNPTADGQQKKIYILLTKQTDPVSRIFGVISGCKYFHASIGFEERGTFFSFNTKRGFCIEQPSIRRQFVPCMLYSLDVTDEVCRDIEERIRTFRDSPRPYGFSYFGMFLCIFRMPLKIPFLFDNSYFCSMFVSELIVKSGAAKLRVKPHRYLPRHFSHESALKLCFEGVWGEPPVFSEDQGDLYTVPVHYAKRYVRKAHTQARVTVRSAKRTAHRTARVTRDNMIFVRNTVFRATGAVCVVCRDNLHTASRLSREAIEKWLL
ncbi:MAG: hypothetical protein LBS91_06130 [Clostridiales Family XIII bacterium]|jgi:inositol transport system substrate-binding protein|nr:hypothetical protein [Clostridiales Family XIII bacterium]